MARELRGGRWSWSAMAVLGGESKLGERIERASSAFVGVRPERLYQSAGNENGGIAQMCVFDDSRV